ncbi:HtaA domain-containing protein [Gordonia sp. (in: high G+C Gram-positive bacteria)]|uniref:HtaA domain-containing protein n=1 Tax=Gordonia sp. (in: high G+C Gram-positive bacteria) TaxID=84139 RepID=UPI00262596C3|nr:HtaA domain-containing protein [Gordonia sp. (in: high G+C Gram-positive bacteria)]
MKLARFVLVSLLALCTAVAGVVLGAPAHAAPKAPAITVYLADGVTPVGNTLLHPGDTVVVKGTGFDPNANTSGLPVPVPPGVPHGTFVAFGKFSPHWRPSQGAPESLRALDRSQTKWAISDDALGRIPNTPFDLRRTVRQQAVPLHRDGTFTAKITLTTPKDAPANGRWGIYTYGAADAVNVAQERFVPINYSTAPGPNTPKPAVRNLVWAYSPNFYSTFAQRTQGAVVGKKGAAVDKRGVLSYELTSNTVRNGRGELRYTGTVVAYTRFHLYEIALADPIIRVTGGRAVLSMRTSTTDQNGTDALRRIDVADLRLGAAQLARLSRGENVTGIAATFRPGVTPALLGLLSHGAASPVNLLF